VKKAINTAAEDESFHVRPRFRLELPCTVPDFEARLKAALANEDCPVEGRVISGHATLWLPAEEQHYWSPQLGLSFEEDGEGTLLRGLYGPRPQVWTMFVLFYSIIGFAVLVIAVFGMSYWTLGKSIMILWWVPVLAALFLTLYLVAYFGQRLGRDQMMILDRFLKNVTNY
jgi:hypothetical protein